MNYEQYVSVIESKVQGAWNFYKALAAIGASLDFFIAISSAAGAVGNRGQAAYAAANTFLNGFAQHLLGQSIPAASIDLTAVSDAGYLAEDAEKARKAGGPETKDHEDTVEHGLVLFSGDLFSPSVESILTKGRNMVRSLGTVAMRTAQYSSVVTST